MDIWVILAIVNNAAMKLGVQISVWFTFGYVPRRGIPGLHGIIRLKYFWGTAILVSIGATLFYIPTSNIQGHNSHINSCRVERHCFCLHFPNINLFLRGKICYPPTTAPSTLYHYSFPFFKASNIVSSQMTPESSEQISPWVCGT